MANKKNKIISKQHYRTKYKSSSVYRMTSKLSYFFSCFSPEKKCKPYLANKEGFIVFSSVLKNGGSGRDRRA